MINFKRETILKFVFLISLISIFSAYFIEYILGHQPCNLCLIERVPYVLSIILILLFFISKKNEKFVTLLLILLFIFSFLISFYHLGIEQGFFKESVVCSTNNAAEIYTKEQLLEKLPERTISCKDVTFKIFGFSLTTINILISLIIITFLLKNFNSNEKNFK